MSSTKIKDFCNKYQEKLRNDKDISENKLDYFRDYRTRISFTVNCWEHTPNVASLGSNLYNMSQTLITLDKEDLKYLNNKYSKLRVKELESNIEKLNRDYGREV